MDITFVVVFVVNELRVGVTHIFPARGTLIALHTSFFTLALFKHIACGEAYSVYDQVSPFFFSSVRKQSLTQK